MRIDRLAPGTARPAQRKTVQGGFHLPEEAAAGEVGQADAVGMVGMLGLQENDPGARDRRAARRAEAMLDALAQLQVAMLEGRADDAALERLAVEAEGEAAADPALATVMAGIALRARVELARRQMQARSATEE